MAENPYRVPDAALAEPARPVVLPSRGEFGSENGSALTIGPRRFFTGEWISGNRFPSLLSSLVWSVPIILVGTQSMMSVAGANVLVLVLVWPIAVSLGVILLAPVRWSGFPPLEPPARPCVPVELSFEPRLPGSRDELRDKADDVGFVWTERDFLAYQGDRVAFRIHRSDVAGVADAWTLNGFFGAWSPEVEIRLAVPLAARRSLRLVRRERIRTPAQFLRNRRLRREIRAWSANSR